MEQKELTSLSLKRCLMVMIVYFLGFTYLLPDVLKKITLMIDPQATIMNIPVMLISYFLVAALLIYIAKPVWKDSLSHFFQNTKNCLYMIVVMIIGILIANYALSMIVALLTNTDNSQNQEIVSQNAVISPLYSFLYTCIIAPGMEETVFRAGIFTWIKKHAGFIPAMLISSLAFGMIHVMRSLFTGNFIDFAYLLVYAGIGMILAYAYEKSGSVLVSVGIHAGNNFVAFLSMIL